MQANRYYGNTRQILGMNRSFTTLFILLLFLLLGAGVGYIAANAAAKSATLNVQVRNDTGTTQDVRIYVNNDPVAIMSVTNGGTATMPFRVGWTSPNNGMYEVRATPLVDGASDTETVTVSNGLTYDLSLRVR